MKKQFGIFLSVMLISSITLFTSCGTDDTKTAYYFKLGNMETDYQFYKKMFPKGEPTLKFIKIEGKENVQIGYDNKVYNFPTIAKKGLIAEKCDIDGVLYNIKKDDYIFGKIQISLVEDSIITVYFDDKPDTFITVTLMIPGETLVVQKMTYDTVKKEIVSIEQDRPAKSLTSAEEVKAAGYMVIHGDFSDLNTTIIHWKNMQYEFHVKNISDDKKYVTGTFNFFGTGNFYAIY